MQLGNILNHIGINQDRITRQIREELYRELEPGGKYEGLHIDPEIVVATAKDGGLHLF